MFVHRDHREHFLFQYHNGENPHSAYISHLYELTYNNNTGDVWRMSELELAAIVEGGRPFVQATYFLEGDGIVILYVYDWLLYIQGFIENQHFPLIDEYVDNMVDDVEDIVEKELDEHISQTLQWRRSDQDLTTSTITSLQVMLGSTNNYSKLHA